MGRKRASGKKRMPLSTDPMRFGLENDLKIALTELRWLKKSKRELKDSDFATVAEKYELPTDFLRKGLAGFDFPDDYLISKSKWFPILYSWVCRNRDFSFNLFRLQFAYIRAHFWSIFTLCALPILFLYIDTFLIVLLEIDLRDRVSFVFLPLIVSLIAFYLELRSYVGGKKASLDDYSKYLEERRLGYIIAENEKFIQRNYRLIVFRGNTVLENLRSSPSLTFIYSGMQQIQRPPKSKRFARFDVVSKKLHLRPKSTAPTEKENIPVFYVENTDLEYRKRIKKLEDQFKTK